MYDSMTYEKHFEYLHMFEGEDGVVAFNFCDYAEANQFYAAVNKKVEMRKKRLERRQQQQQQSARSQSNNNTPMQYMSRRETNSQKKPLKKARTLTKADIGTPTDFKHISHVGWTEDSGFDIDTEDVQLRTFFDKVLAISLMVISKTLIHLFSNNNTGGSLGETASRQGHKGVYL